MDEVFSIACGRLKLMLIQFDFVSRFSVFQNTIAPSLP